MVTVGIAADHGGIELKEILIPQLKSKGYSVTDFGAQKYEKDDDYPDLVFPMAQAVSEGKVDRGIAICGSGVGACVVANRLPGVRAALIHEVYSAHQGVEDDNMNVMCLGGRVVGAALAMELVNTFLEAKFRNVDPYRRRVEKVNALEEKERTR